jgi:hypothetical protein
MYFLLFYFSKLLFCIIFKSGIDATASTRDGYTAVHFLSAQRLPDKVGSPVIYDKK